MSNSKQITSILNSVVTASKEIIPFEVISGNPCLVSEHKVSANLSLLIGVIGDYKGRLIIEASDNLINSIAEKMYGMKLDNTMLSSFFGELGNMIAGRLCTLSFEEGVKLDITPPTVMIGEVKITGFEKGIKIPLQLNSSVEVNIYITLSLEQSSK